MVCQSSLLFLDLFIYSFIFRDKDKRISKNKSEEKTFADGFSFFSAPMSNTPSFGVVIKGALPFSFISLLRGYFGKKSQAGAVRQLAMYWVILTEAHHR